MTTRSTEAGFSAAELLITLFVGAAFIGGASQLYTIAIGDSGANRTQAIASNLAYTTMRTKSSQLSGSTSSCAPGTTNPSAPTGISLPKPVTIAVVVTCPYTTIDGFNPSGSPPTNSTLSQITVTVSYGNPTKKITHSVYASSQ